MRGAVRPPRGPGPSPGGAGLTARGPGSCMVGQGDSPKSSCLAIPAARERLLLLLRGPARRAVQRGRSGEPGPVPPSEGRQEPAPAPGPRGSGRGGPRAASAIGVWALDSGRGGRGDGAERGAGAGARWAGARAALRDDPRRLRGAGGASRPPVPVRRGHSARRRAGPREALLGARPEAAAGRRGAEAAVRRGGRAHRALPPR